MLTKIEFSEAPKVRRCRARASSLGIFSFSFSLFAPCLFRFFSSSFSFIFLFFFLVFFRFIPYVYFNLIHIYRTIPKESSRHGVVTTPSPVFFFLRSPKKTIRRFEEFSFFCFLLRRRPESTRIQQRSTLKFSRETVKRRPFESPAFTVAPIAVRSIYLPLPPCN